MNVATLDISRTGTGHFGQTISRKAPYSIAVCHLFLATANTIPVNNLWLVAM